MTVPNLSSWSPREHVEFLKFLSALGEGPLSPFASVQRWNMTPGGEQWPEVAARERLQHPSQILNTHVHTFSQLISGRVEGLRTTLEVWSGRIEKLSQATDGGMRNGKALMEALRQVEWLSQQRVATSKLLEEYVRHVQGGRYVGPDDVATNLQRGLVVFFGTADPAVASANVAFQIPGLSNQGRVTLYLTNVEKGFPKAPAAPRAGGSAALVLLIAGGLLAGGAIAWKLLSQSSPRENVA